MLRLVSLESLIVVVAAGVSMSIGVVQAQDKTPDKLLLDLRAMSGQLQRDADRLRVGSPVRDKAVGDMPFTAEDLSARERRNPPVPIPDVPATALRPFTSVDPDDFVRQSRDRAIQIFQEQQRLDTHRDLRDLLQQQR